jgi:hypothetical protein
MIDTEEEGLGFIGALKERFAGKLDRAERRMQAERRAGETEGEKSRRKGPPKGQLNVRASDQTRRLFEALCNHLGKSKTDVLELAIAELAKAHKLTGER